MLEGCRRLAIRRSSRLFEIIQVLRRAPAPLPAHTIATMLEVNKRTVYRDVATLQAMRVPIEGEAGIGYVMRRGFDLPPLMFTTEELQAVVVGLALLDRTRDDGLRQAAARVRQKLADVVPPQVGAIDEVPLRTSSWSDIPPSDTDCGLVRRAIREECKLRFDYRSRLSAEHNPHSHAADAHILDRRYRARRMVRVARGLSAFPGRPHEFVCLQRRPLCWRGTAAPAGLGELRRGLRRDSAPIAGIAKVHPSRRTLLSALCPLSASEPAPWSLTTFADPKSDQL